MSLTQDIAQMLRRAITDYDRARAAILFLDWTACAVAGASEPAGLKMTKAFKGDCGDCTRIGSTTASVQMAAFHNGALGNILEMDDVDKRAVLHAAPTVIPAALAMAEHVGASANDFLDAIVHGYDVTIRIGRAVGACHYAFWHNTATCGPFGAAAAASHLLDESNLVSALGLAGTQAAGLWQTRHEADSMAKQIHAAHAAQVGVQSAILSAQGFQGPRMILEGEQGFFKAMCPGADPRDVLADYSHHDESTWLIHQTSIKPYPACRHAHAAIDAALLARKAGINADDGIIVETYTDALKFCDRPNPQTTIEAKFSLQHSVAVTLLKGEPSLDDFNPKNTNEAVKALRDKIEVKTSKTFDVAYPNHYGAAVIIDGQTFEATDAYGDPENPMSLDAVKEKAKRLMHYSSMDESRAEALIEASLNVDLEAYKALIP
ncbi:MmgE/PrpD family protein [Fretibacter rubidus]|uniref:MmgE/PrpD family protein n=1 Tax=Fretibacter rubidus TaxID=570162 RepID=UPI00352A10BE